MRGWSKIGIGVVAGLLLLSACSSGGDGGGGGTPSSAPQKVSAEAYVKDLCGGIQTYLTDVQTLSSNFSSSIDPTASAQDQAAAVGSFLDDVISKTDTLVATVKAAGVPDVDGGQEVATTLTATFQKVSDALQQARDKVDSLPTGDPAAFATELTNLGTEIQSSLSGIGNSLGTLSSSQLDQAFSAEPTCQGISSSPSP
jgi:hypothetical protein